MALTRRGISSPIQMRTSRVPTLSSQASQAGKSGHTPASSRTSGTDRTASSTTVKIAQPISSTVMYLGETRIQLMPAGSIASLGILPLALGLGSVVLGRVGLFGRELAEMLHHQPYHHHDQATAHHSQHGRQLAHAGPVEQQDELVHQ